jgi:SAM-dependent methyltransferase
MTSPIAYADRFQEQDAVDSYESGEYGQRSYSTFIWSLQQPVLVQLLNDLKLQRSAPMRLLDFACGTGRILASVEALVDDAEGIDISERMVKIAREKCPRATLSVGDVSLQPDLLRGPYDVITCFRFVLNVEPDVGRDALRSLRRAISEPDGRLIFTVHGNSRSLRHASIAWKRWRLRKSATVRGDVMLNEMSPTEARRLIAECGFEVVEQVGFGILPPTLYRTPLRAIAVMVDSFAASRRLWKNRSIELFFVCRPV